MSVLRDRATQITEAAAQAELDFFRDIDPERRIVMAFEGDLCRFVARKGRRDETAFWFIEASGPHLSPVPLRDAALSARLEFVRDWEEMRNAYLQQIRDLEVYALGTWP